MHHQPKALRELKILILTKKKLPQWSHPFLTYQLTSITAQILSIGGAGGPLSRNSHFSKLLVTAETSFTSQSYQSFLVPSENVQQLTGYVNT